MPPVFRSPSLLLSRRPTCHSWNFTFALAIHTFFATYATCCCTLLAVQLADRHTVRHRNRKFSKFILQAEALATQIHCPAGPVTNFGHLVCQRELGGVRGSCVRILPVQKWNPLQMRKYGPFASASTRIAAPAASVTLSLFHYILRGPGPIMPSSGGMSTLPPPPEGGHFQMKRVTSLDEMATDSSPAGKLPPMQPTKGTFAYMTGAGFVEGASAALGRKLCYSCEPAWCPLSLNIHRYMICRCSMV